MCPKTNHNGDKVHVYYNIILWQVYNESVKYGDTAYTWCFLVMNNLEFRFLSQT
jgi:hypothetical protein